MTAQDLQCDVLVIGLGPVGAVLTGLLGQSGLSVIAVEQQAGVYPLSRAAHIDHEVMRVFQALDLVEAIQPHIRIARSYEFRTADDQLLMRFERDGVIGPSGWPIGFNVYQPGLEDAVRTRLAELTNVRMMMGNTFVRATASGNGLLAKIENASGAEHSIHARYVVGCDGASSSVRATCAIPLDDYAFDEPWLVLDAIVPDETGFPPVTLQLCDPERPTTFVRLGPGRVRWEFMLKPGETAQSMLDQDSIEALLKPWRERGEIRVERSAVYSFHGLVARTWRQGRMLLAGDAAHQMPPFLGQGLCAGIRDAANLAWKLKEVLSSADDSILDSYQAEREPHVRFVIERAIEMGRVICTLDPATAAARDAKMLANPVVGAPIQFPSISGMTLDDTAQAGSIFPQPIAGSTDRLDDFLGPGAWLIHRTGERLLVEGLTCIDVDHDAPAGFASHLRTWLDAVGVEAVLVRPDRYIFGTGAARRLALEWTSRLSAVATPTSSEAPASSGGVAVRNLIGDQIS